MNNLPESHQTPTIKLYHWVVIISVGMLVVAGFVAWLQQWALVDSLIGVGIVGFFLAALVYIANDNQNPEMRRDQPYRHFILRNTEVKSQYSTSNWQSLNKMLFVLFVASSLNVGLGMLINWLGR